MSRVHFFDDKQLLLRQAVVAWLALLCGVAVFTVLAVALSRVIDSQEIVVLVAFALVLPPVIATHILMKRNHYRIKQPTTMNVAHDYIENNKVNYNEGHTLTTIDDVATEKQARPRRELVPVFMPRSVVQIFEGATPSDKRGLVITDTGGQRIYVSIHDTAQVVVASPIITSVFLRAVAKVATSVFTGLVSGAVSEVIITINEAAASIEYEYHRQKITLNVTKLRLTTEIIAKEIKAVESNPEFPDEMKEELKKRLYKLFYDEMEKLSFKNS